MIRQFPRLTEISAAARAINLSNAPLCVCAIRLQRQHGDAENLDFAIQKEIVPEYFGNIKERIKNLKSEISNPKSKIQNPKFVAGGTDLYVQKPDELVYTDAENLFDNSDLRFINETDEFVEIGASVVVTDLLESPIFQRIFPNLYKHLKLVSSTPIRNMATLAGNFVNASPIGDMTAWFLALDAEIDFQTSRSDPNKSPSKISISATNN